MFTETGMVVALAHVLMPFMVLAVWAALQRLDPQIENAAVSLGAGPFTILRRIVLPQVMPGVLSGAIIVFALAASAFATPAIIGGRRLKVAATLAYDEFLNTLNWPLGAAVAVLLLVALVLIVVGSNALVERRYARGVPMSRNGPLALVFHALFVIFMLAPILVVCLVAFTPEGYLSLPTDRLVAALVHGDRPLSRVHLAPSGAACGWARCPRPSRVAVLGAGGAGHRALSLPRPRGDDGAVPVAADDPARRARHRLPALLHRRSGSAAPSPGWCWRTSSIVLPFALRLTLASAIGMDRAIEHAAVSLGASDWTVFRRVTLPLILPGLVSGWALAFIKSFDEVTMTVFIAAPGTETLPVRMFLYIQDNIDPLVTSVSACVIADHRAGADRARPRLRPRPAAGRARAAGDGDRCSETTTSPSSAAGWSASAIAWGLGARAASASSCSTRATAPCAPRAATSRWSGCRARGSACPPMPAGRSARPTPGAGFAADAEGGDRPRCLLPAARRLPSRAVGEASSRRAPTALKRLHNQPGIADYKTEMLDHAPGREDAAATSGPRWSAAATARSTATSIRCALFRALHTAHQRARRRPTCRSHRGRGHHAGAAASSG